MKAPKAKYPKCGIPDCWQEATNRAGGLCVACGAWWRRINLYSGSELAHYLRRLDRFASRAGRLHNRKVVPVRRRA